MAWYIAVAAAVGGAAGAVAFDQEQLRFVAVAAGAVHQLAGQAAAEMRMFLRSLRAFFALVAASRASAASDHLLHDLLGVLGFSSRYLRQKLVDDAGDDAVDFRVVEPDLGLRFELRLRHGDADHGRHALRGSPRRCGVIVLEEVFLVAVGVQRAGQGGAEAGQMRAAARVVGVVGVAADALLLAGGVLKGDLDLDVVDASCPRR